MAEIKRVMISSTARDLPQHRKTAMDACLSQGMFPSMMEHLPASDNDAIEASLRMVEGADIYVGIFAYRYGYIPSGHEVSITEMEYNHAKLQGLPCFIFLIHPDHPQDGLLADNEPQLNALKARLQTEQVVNFFKSPDDLRAHLINSLSHYRTRPAIYEESRQFSSTIRQQMKHAQKQIDALTGEQYQLMNSLRYQRRLAIAGCAGSGKTLIAAEKALRLDEAGFRTLILCHSYYLAQHIRSLVKGTGVKVLDFTTWIKQIIGQDQSAAAQWNHYDEPLEHELDEAFDKLLDSNERYEAILIDEGQDFRELWWTIIEAALVSQEYGILYVFHDDNQALLPSRSKYPLMSAPIVLSKNCRNTGQVFELVRRLHPQSPETAMLLKEQGIVKQWVYHTGEEHAAVDTAFQAALKAIEPEEIVVLTTEQEPLEQSLLEGMQIILRPKWRWQEAVQKYLGTIEGLSDYPCPTEEDVLLVQTFTRETYSESAKASSRLRYVRWRYDDDNIYLLHPFGDNRGINTLRGFFTLPDWAADIPRPRTFTISTTPGQDVIRLFTISAFKGLESPGVLLFVPYPFTGQRNELEANIYVGISRARLLLHMIIDKQMVSRIRPVMLPYGWE